MKVFVKENVIAPMWICLKFFSTSVKRPPPIFIAGKSADQSIADLPANLEQVHQFSRSCRAFDLEVVAIVEVELLKGSKEHHIYRQPYRSAPIGVPAKHSIV